jgi:nucleotide-binding universal stress UspA family protein
MYERIIVPLDGSELAERALGEAEKTARSTGAQILLLRVTDPIETNWYATVATAMDFEAVQAVMANETSVATSYLEDVAQRLRESGLQVEIETRQGRASREIVQAAHPEDIIVMASHGRSGVSRWLLGSVAEDVLRHASGPVLLVRASDSDQPTAPGAQR